jgi:hypothetical protein
MLTAIKSGREGSKKKEVSFEAVRPVGSSVWERKKG